MIIKLIRALARSRPAAALGGAAGMLMQVEAEAQAPADASAAVPRRLAVQLDMDSAADAHPDPLIVLDGEARIVSLNPAACRLLELEEAAAQGLGFLEHCVVSDDRYRVAAALRAGGSAYLGFKVRTGSGVSRGLTSLLLPAAGGAGHLIMARPLIGSAAPSPPAQAPEPASADADGALVAEVARLLSVAPAECFARTLQDVLAKIGGHCAADRVFLVPADEFGQRHRYQGTGWDRRVERALPLWKGRRKAWLWHALREGRLRLHVDVPGSDAEAQELLAAAGAAGLLCLPLISEGHLIGALVLESADGDANWQWLGLRPLELLADILGSALLRHLRERELTEERARLLEAQSLASLGYWDWLPESDRLQCSASALRVLRADAPAADVGRQWLLAQVHPQEQERLAEQLGALVESGRQFDGEYRLSATAESAPRWVRLQACWGRDSDGERRVRGNVLDVTPLKRREQEVLAAHARLEHLIDSAPLVVYVAQPGEQRQLPVFFSDNAGSLFGFEREEMLRPGWWESRVHEADVGQALRAREALVRDGHSALEYRLRDGEGRYRWIYDEANLILDEQGQPTEVVGLWLDITDKRRIEAAVRESEARYRALVEDSPTLICRLSADLRLGFVNSTCGDYFGLPISEMQGRNWLDFVFPDDRSGYLQRIHALTPESPVVSYEQRVVLASGEVRWQFWSDRAFFENGELVEIQAVGRDTTELREARAKLAHAAKMATIGALATGVAHELNQPLNVMRLAIKNILNRAHAGTLDNEFVESKLERIERQVGRASGIVDQMRMFGRKSSKTPEPFDLTTPVDGALDLLREQLAKHAVAVEWQPVTGARRALGYPDQVEQVVINLLVNGRDAIAMRREADGEPERPGLIRIELEDDPQAERLCLVVRDNGGGIPDHVIDKIFDPFFTTKEVGKGTGLGLSLSFGMLQDMGGGIAVRNVDGGAEFRLSVPMAPEDTDPRATVSV